MANPNRPLLAGLTAARFFAAFHVLLFHMYAMKGLARAPAWFQTFASVGYVAVTFFFILSGFVLVYTYAGSGVELRKFWRARLARLYPVYVFSLLLAAPFFFYVVLKFNVPQLAWIRAHLVATVVLVLTMLQAWVPLAALGWNGVAWAVSVEIFFYLLFPTLLARLSRISSRGLATIALTGWILAIAAALIYVVLSPDHVIADSSQDFLPWLSLLKFNPLVRLPEFLVGMACGYWFVRGGNSEKHATPLVLGGTALALVITAFSPRIAYPVLHTGFYAPAFAAIICGLALRPRWCSFLEIRPLRFLGESSYALYLLHALFIGAILYAGSSQVSGRDKSAPPSIPSSLGRITIAPVAALVAALLTYRFIEEPARKWLRGRAAAKPAPATMTA